MSFSFAGVVSRQAGVLRIIRIGLEHRGRVRPQRAVHESLQHSGVQHQVGLRMRVALLVQLLDWIVEGQPFRNARGQLAFFFQLFVDLKIFPVGRIILRRGHAMLGEIGERKFQSFSAELVASAWESLQHRCLRRLAQNAGRLAVLVAVNLPALRIAAGQGDAAQLQRARVGHGDVAVDSHQEHRDVRRTLRRDPSA